VSYAGKTKAVLNQILAILNATAGMQLTYKGVPESPGAKVTASVSVGDAEPNDKMAGYHEITSSFFVEWAYRVATAEANAEDVLADWRDSFVDAWLADRTLNNTCRTSTLDFSLARTPAYRPIAGAEFRVSPVVVSTVIPR
jgi:hypothetical protein